MRIRNTNTMAATYDLSGFMLRVNRSDMYSDIIDNINETIGYNKFTINYVQGSNDASTLEEGQDVTLETDEDVKEFIKEMQDSGSETIIVENVRGILYISNKETSYWLHTRR